VLQSQEQSYKVMPQSTKAETRYLDNAPDTEVSQKADNFDKQPRKISSAKHRSNSTSNKQPNKFELQQNDVSVSQPQKKP
jgi:hypothetical protein